MIKAIIIDDEKNALEVLRMQLVNYCKEVQVVKICVGGREGIEAIHALSPDLVFLDIEMPMCNGFDVLEATKDKGYKVIFTTAYDQFALKAFRYSAIDYLLKPIDIEELIMAVKKVQLAEPKEIAGVLEKLYKQFDSVGHRQRKVALPIGDGLEMVPLQNIIRCESESNYTTIYLQDKRKVTLSKTLKDIEDLLSYPPFYRIHNSHIVNIDFIQKIFKTDGGYVIMSDGAHINISRSRKDSFFESLQKW